VKDSVINLLVFLLVSVGAMVFLVAMYLLGLLLIPGGKGLIFSNPYASALLPSLLAGLLTAQYRAVRRPGNFPLTWAFLAVAFLLLLTLPLPIIQSMPPVRASDESPLVDGRFLHLDDGSLLLATGKASVLIPESDTMTVSSLTQYDPLNQRFVFSAGDPKTVGTGPEQIYFQYTPALVSVQTDFLAVHTALKDTWPTQIEFWTRAAVVTCFFLGFFVFFSIRTWPLVHIILLLLLVRVGLSALVYSFWSLPALVRTWAPGADWMAAWAPMALIGTASATLFFMTWLTKPYRRSALQ
jgi:hypothetical protein